MSQSYTGISFCTHWFLCTTWESSGCMRLLVYANAPLVCFLLLDCESLPEINKIVAVPNFVHTGFCRATSKCSGHIAIEAAMLPRCVCSLDQLVTRRDTSLDIAWFSISWLKLENKGRQLNLCDTLKAVFTCLWNVPPLIRLVAAISYASLKSYFLDSRRTWTGCITLVGRTSPEFWNCHWL